VLSPIGLLIAIVAALAVIVGVVLVTGFLTPPGSSSSAGPPASAQVVVRSQASSVAFEDGAGWLADDGDGTVRRFDPATGAFAGHAARTGGRPISIAAGGGRVWVADISGNQISAVSTRTGRESLGPFGVAQGPVSVAVGEGGVWVASLLSGTVSFFDPANGEVRASVALPDGAVRLALGDGYVWVTGQTDTLTRIDPRPLGVSLEWKSARVGQGPLGVAVGEGAVWVANAESGTLSRVDPHTLKVTGTFPVPAGSSGSGATSGLPGSSAGAGSDPETVAVWQGRVWVGGGQSPEVVAIDPRSGAEVGRAVALPGIARDLVVGADGDLWAATANPGRVVRLVPS